MSDDNPFLAAAEALSKPQLRAVRRAHEKAARRKSMAETPGGVIDIDGPNTSTNWRHPDGRQVAFFDIPMPPSVNNLWANVGKRRIRTEAYDKWKVEAGWEIRAQRVMSFTKPVKVDIRVARLNGASDIDNRIKPVLDLLQDLAILSNDNIVIEVRCRWWPAKNGARITITQATPSELELAKVTPGR